MGIRQEEFKMADWDILIQKLMGKQIPPEIAEPMPSEFPPWLIEENPTRDGVIDANSSAKNGNAFQTIADHLGGRGKLTPNDVVAIKKGPQENRGVANILQNLDLMGAERRAAGRGLAWETEDREINNDLKRAQADNLRSLGTYRGGLLDLKAADTEIKRQRNEIYGLKTNADIQAKQQELEIKLQNAQTAIQNAETSAKNAATSEERLAWEKEKEQRQFEYDKTQDLINNELKRQALLVQQGYLGIAQEKAPSDIARTEAGTRLADAQTTETEQRTEKAESPYFQLGNIMDSIQKGQKAGLLTPSGSRIAFENFGGPELSGVNAPEPSVIEKIKSVVGPKQTPATSKKISPKAAKPSVKTLTPELAKGYLRKAGGNKTLARQLAKADGYSF
jgi:hypothetical protein